MTSLPDEDFSELEAAMAASAAAVEDCLDTLLPAPEGPEAPVLEAMRYAVLGGGKRLRPFLLMEAGRLFGAPEAWLLRAAAAVECVHSYSLVHDDLPCMDDDPMRRGKPSTHIAFGEAAAVLAGDALLTLAFAILAEEESHRDALVRVRLIAALAEAAGPRGMVAGQMADLSLERAAPSLEDISRLQRLKTGALIGFCLEAGALIGQADEEAGAALAAYGRDLGLAYQIADDLLDAEASPEELGKATAKDAARGKATFPLVLGTAGARTRALNLADKAAGCLDFFGEKAKFLRRLARYVVARRR